MLIGGFYGIDSNILLDESCNKEGFQLRLDVKDLYDRKIYTNNGRTASVYALNHCKEKMAGKKILIPDYLCLSIISALEAGSVDYEFYRVNRDLSIDVEDVKEKLTEEIGMIYVTHYFTVPQPKEVVDAISKMAKEKDILIMEDITQCLFSKDVDRMGFGHYIVSSTRKWFPMTDGGLLAIRNGVEGQDQELAYAYDESVYKELLISSLRPQYDANPELEKAMYLQYEKEANAARYKNLVPRDMTAASKKILFNTDVTSLMEKRIENHNALYKRLSEIPEIQILSKDIGSSKDYVPFGLVILAEKRQELYNHLVNNNVIPEIQWILPVEYYEPGVDAQYLSDHNLMLQCDQRYDVSHMEYVADVIEEFFKLASKEALSKKPPLQAVRVSGGSMSHSRK